MIRQPIVVLVGHIDHGKSSILERIKGISIIKGEAGGITQSLKSYHIPFASLEKFCGPLLKTFSFKITLPGLLFLDTPGHAAFTNMRKRGGNLADLAIVVVDCQQGVQEQTIESITILRQYKTPFIVALNKIDLLDGWRSGKTTLLQSIKSQQERVQEALDKILYTVVAKLSALGFQAERFDRVQDYTNQVALVPVSAKTGEGLQELLMVLMGLAQKYLEKSLQVEVRCPGKGTILEVKEEAGLGVVLDVVLYDGSLKANDTIVLGTMDKPLVTKVKALFEQERGSRGKLKPVKEVHAACGVLVVAPQVEGVVGGMPIRVAEGNVEQMVEEVQAEIEEVVITTDHAGVIIKADTLGSLEALAGLLRQQQIPIKRAALGSISKKDIADAKAEREAIYKVILGFNIEPLKTDVKTICHPVIYKIIEEYTAWKEQQSKQEELHELEGITRPCRLRILRGCIFRQSHPAVVGVRVEAGTLTTGVSLIKRDGSKGGVIKSMQEEGESIQEAGKGKEVAVSIPGVIVGRQIKEDDVLLSDIPEQEFLRYKQFKKYLKADEKEVLQELAEIKRKQQPTWGV
ncbi:translation initiation factor IF-2 [Candidatus Woesearchaeota archaeon]|nr:translation initiation factor IF-2 [Candidatus Woesearchaeota archaeon]